MSNAESCRRWRKRHPEQMREIKRRWRMNHPDYASPAQKAWRNPPERARIASKRWRMRNKKTAKLISKRVQTHRRLCIEWVRKAYPAVYEQLRKKAWRLISVDMREAL